MYEELVKRCKALRDYNGLVSDEMIQECWDCVGTAADAIEELLKAAKKMHTWIFLHSYDEQEAYDECGLSDEMNAALGYGGRLEIVVPKEET